LEKAQQRLTKTAVRAVVLWKTFRLGDTTGVDLDIGERELVAILGPSGSGKCTLLGLLGGLDTPDSGRVEIAGVNITHMFENQLAKIRSEKIGFVFQFFNLIPTLTALENAELPIQLFRYSGSSSKARAVELLTLVGLAGRVNHRPAQLSGGKQQRVAIARALANGPALILADEPTGNLDTGTGEKILETLLGVRREAGSTLVIVTHDSRVAQIADRVMHMQDGKFALI